MTITGKRPKRAAWFELTEAASVGIEMAVAVAIGWFGGRWLETHVTHWAPTRWFGLAFGLGAAAMAVVRTVLVFGKKLAEEERALGPGAAAADADPEAVPGAATPPSDDPADPGRGPADDA